MNHLQDSSLSGKETVQPPVMDLIERLREHASVFATNLTLVLPALIAERKRLEETPAQAQPRLAYLKEEQEAALMAPVRLDMYTLELHRHPPFCPYCWMLHGRRTSLRRMLEDAAAMSCDICGSAY